MTGAAGCCWEDPSLVGIAALVCAASKAGAVHDLGHDDHGATINSHRANSEGAMVRTGLPDAVMLAGALALLAAVIALPLWG
jgi:hypothetical protein